MPDHPRRQQSRRPSPRARRSGSGGRAAAPVRRTGPIRSPRVRRRRLALAVTVLVLGTVALLALGWRLLGDWPEPTGESPPPAEESSVSSDPESSAIDPGVAAAEKSIKVPSYLGGHRRDLTEFGPAPAALNLVWKHSIGSGQTRAKQDNSLTTWSGTGWTGQPTVVSEGKRNWLLVGGYDHNLHRIDAKSGKLKWEAQWPDVMKGTNTVVANPEPADETWRLIVVSGSRRGVDKQVGDDGIAPLRAVSFATGKELWRLPVPKTHNYSQDVDSSPLWYKGVLYAPVEPGYVYSLDPFKTVDKDGMTQPVVIARSPRLYDDEDVTAHPDIGGANLAIESSPAAIGDVIYITSGAGHVYGLDRKTLEVVWDFKTGSDIDGTPSVTSDGKLLISLEEQYVDEPGGAYLLDPSKPPSDAVVWYYPTPSRGFGEWAGGCIGSVTSNEASNDGTKPRLAALNTIDGAVRVVSIDRRTSKKAKGPGASKAAPAPLEIFTDGIGGSISTPVIVGDSMVTAGYGNTVYLYRFSYKAAKKSDTGAVPSPDGRWWTVDVKRIDSFKGGAAFESTPLVWNGHVFVGCRDGYLYCLGD